jgi:cytoskeleton protein RodZ
MAAFSEQLRREREQRGVAIDAISEQTKVAPRYIRALEAGEFAEMPGGVFRKSFVRSYITALGLDEGVWMPRFEQSCRASGLMEPADTQWVTFAENVKRNRGSMRHRRSAGIGLAILMILLGLSIATWCVWRAETHRRLVPGRPAWLHLKHRADKAAQG